MLRRRGPGGYAEHAEGRRERVARGAVREAWASTAWRDGGGSMEDGVAGFLPWTTNGDNNAGVVDPRPVRDREEWRTRLETIDRHKGRD